MNILLVCTAGMSTSMLVKRMKDVAVKKNIKVNIWAVGDAKSKEETKKADVIMLGPQVRFLENKIKGYVENKKPVIVIDMQMYGRMDGEAVLNEALKALEK